LLYLTRVLTESFSLTYSFLTDARFFRSTTGAFKKTLFSLLTRKNEWHEQYRLSVWCKAERCPRAKTTYLCLQGGARCSHCTQCYADVNPRPTPLLQFTVELFKLEGVAYAVLWISLIDYWWSRFSLW